MKNITERISLLDELRGKLNNGLIGNEFDDAVWEFVKAYDTILRQAALDSERYRKAGEALVRYMEEACELPEKGLKMNIKSSLEAYRQEVEQKEV